MAVNKIALVTGGSRGLGKEMALSLAATGVDVVITYNSKKEEAEAVVADIRSRGRKAAALQLNVAEVKSFDAFAASFKATLNDTFGSANFQYLVNNAGIGIHASFMETTEEMFDTLVNIQFKGVFFLTQKLLPVMEDGGAIVNVSTGLARFSLPGYAAYASMKGAIETLTRYLAKELGDRKIRANVIAPGAIETDFGGGVVRDNQQVNAHIASQTALGRVGLPDDIGNVVAFLCSDDAKWVTAQRLEASGGMFL
ncbi:SDR family oxidoreductase [Chitinophaga horti]|uniref:SDR family oxidoreductase n=1 Tax=Chitinophaga horti TaxID=2920382 RepID=A0ABY6J063_9BACT|nr:SDR family oxidoreductase [Chitinophaga horti]UYQ91709.1 SDR family oxidoreductase [Chitinophaga horti]